MSVSGTITVLRNPAGLAAILTGLHAGAVWNHRLVLQGDRRAHGPEVMLTTSRQQRKRRRMFQCVTSLSRGPGSAPWSSALCFWAPASTWSARGASPTTMYGTRWL